MLDIFNNNAFSMVSLTESINKLPYTPSRIGSMGLFQQKGVKSLQVSIEEKHGKLQLLSTKKRGEKGDTSSRDPRYARVFRVPHIPHDDTIEADDVQDVRAFGSETQLETVSTVVNDRLEQMRQDHEVTAEWHRIGALKGVILDADATSVVYDLFDEFGLAQTSVSFDFSDTSSGYMKQKATDVIRLMQVALGATGWRSIHAMCGDGFFDALVRHQEVRESYERWQNNSFAREQQIGTGGFEWAGITWENYRGSIGDVKFVNDDKAHFFPVGSPGLFLRYNAPANFMETVNTIGRPHYAKQQRMRMDMGVELHSQANPLHICTRPKCLIEGTDDTP